MIDWTMPMKQEFKYYLVDPFSWKDIKPIDTVKSSDISRDSGADTLGSATFDMDLDIGEAYIRTYLLASQNGEFEKIPLGTHIIQTPSLSHDGAKKTISMDAYTPLLELTENQPPIGYYIPKGDNVLEHACRLLREHCRCPIVETKSRKTLFRDFVSDGNESWLEYISALVEKASYNIGLDELGRIIFEPKQLIKSMQPRYTFDTGNSSILYNDISVTRDLYKIPNVVEVVYSSNTDYIQHRVVNDDPNSPTSIQARGREITKRIINPDDLGNATKAQIIEYAENALKALSTLEYTVTYKHGYCPVRVGDCVRINHPYSDLDNIKAIVVAQSISCEPGCPVSETAKFTRELWG